MRVENYSALEYKFFGLKGNPSLSENWRSLFPNDSRLRVLVFVEDGGQSVAAMYAWDTQKHVFRSLITPPLMPNTGLTWLTYFEKNSKRISKEKEIVEALLEFGNSGPWKYWKFDFPATFIDMQSAIWQGIQPKQKYTYRLNLTEGWMASVDSKLRNILQKRDTFAFDIRSFTSSEFQVFSDALQRKGLAHVGFTERLCKEGSRGFYSVVGEGGNFLALCASVNGTTYYLAASNAKQNNALSACGIAFCIEEARQRGDSIFDFEGSMIPEVERFFRGFGGELSTFYSLEKGRGLIYFLTKVLGK